MIVRQCACSQIMVLIEYFSGIVVNATARLYLALFRLMGTTNPFIESDEMNIE